LLHAAGMEQIEDRMGSTGGLKLDYQLQVETVAIGFEIVSAT